MKTKVSIGLFLILLIILIPYGLKSVQLGDTRSFVLSLLSVILAFFAVVWNARRNSRKDSRKKQ